jgi:AAA domain
MSPVQLPVLTREPQPITHASEKQRLVVYGDPGVGKTTLAMTFPRPFVLNTDDGLIAVTALDPDAELGLDFDVQSYDDLAPLYFWLRDHADLYDTIIIDSLDELAFVLTDELIARHTAYDVRKKGSSYDPHPVFEMIPEQSEYQANQRQLHALLTNLRRLDKHIVVCIGVRDIDPPKVNKRQPNLAPGAMRDLMRWASVAGELVIADEGHALLVKNGDEKRESKTRFAVLSPYVLDPTFEKLNQGAK